MPRRILEGKIVSDKMDKTVTVLVERRYMHPLLKKYIRSSTKYAAHDERNDFKVGDKVAIQECRPISKNKKWVVISDIEAVKKQRHADVSVDFDATGAVQTTAANAAKAPKTAAKAAPKAKKPAAKKK